MVYETGTVVIVPFPFTDRQSRKRRTAVVINTPNYELQTGHVVLLMITSAKQSAWYNDTPIVDYQSVGLPQPCRVRQKVFTLDAGLILSEKGALSKQDWRNLCPHAQDSFAVKLSG